jgi:arylsulfatase
MDFVYDGGGMGKAGTATVSADNTVVATGRVLKTTPFRFSTEETLDFGEDTGTPVDMSYDVPSRFTGELEKVVVDLK